MLNIKLKAKTYKLFIDYAIKTCDLLSLVFEKNELHTNEYALQYEYSLISESIVNKENIAIHPNTGSCFENADICYLGTSLEISSFLKKAYNIFDWDGEKFPEELCFYREGRIWFSCICHEKLLFIHNETPDDVEFLTKNKIKFTYEN